jgi:hypothetical protein
VENTVGPATLLAQISTLRFPPAQLNAAQFRDVFNRLSAMEIFNYLTTGDGVEMATPLKEGGEMTKIGLNKEAVHVAFDPVNKSAEFAVEQLIAIVKEVAAILPMPVFVHQSHVIRKVLPLKGATDARQFMLDSVVQIPAGRIEGWKRQFASVGMRFIFPPQQVNELSAHDLKVESFMQDPSKLFIENTANFLTPMPAGQWDTLKANLAEANRFLDEYSHALISGAPRPEA